MGTEENIWTQEGGNARMPLWVEEDNETIQTDDRRFVLKATFLPHRRVIHIAYRYGGSCL
jgi:hypothetical protein